MSFTHLENCEGCESEGINYFILGMMSSPFIGPFPNMFDGSPILTFLPSFLLHILLSAVPAICTPREVSQLDVSYVKNWVKKEMAPDQSKMHAISSTRSKSAVISRNIYYVPVSVIETFLLLATDHLFVHWLDSEVRVFHKCKWIQADCLFFRLIVILFILKRHK